MDGVPPRDRGIGFVFQDYALFPKMTVLDNIAFGLRVQGVPPGDRHRKTSEMLDLVGLAEEADRAVETLSGGQRQRVALARALAVSPSLLLLDEPLSALDIKVRERLRREIAAVQKKVGITMLIVTHDHEEAMELRGPDRGDQRRAIRAGRPPRDVYQAPATEFVAKFIGEVEHPPRPDLPRFRLRREPGDPYGRERCPLPWRNGQGPVAARGRDAPFTGDRGSRPDPRRVTSISWLGAHLRVEVTTEEGYPLTTLVQRSHSMADRLSAGDNGSAWPPCGDPLSPIPLGKKNPNISCEVPMNAMGRYLPVFHDVFGASVLVVGAGAVGTRRFEALLAGGARITVVAKEFSRPWRSARLAGI